MSVMVFAGGEDGQGWTMFYCGIERRVSYMYTQGDSDVILFHIYTS